MPHSKTPGGQQASEKHFKQEAQKYGLGADNAPSHTEGTKPSDKPVYSDSTTSNVGIDNSSTNVPGEPVKGGPRDS
ncbi:hypothetical protein H2201_005183 [Coniosporium apollinis]|uniref:SMP domain-containing protein n=2 Tax=Coniosporium TaxID=2810619 RepID=A0ABQ9NX15_9PEZI|nr:hypothetical protein H2199_006286 [Cladosporium sp. JES 115]KAJ9664435.1 hypothetical protein H2201_005183 [Coniosporium apollinis]